MHPNNQSKPSPTQKLDHNKYLVREITRSLKRNKTNIINCFYGDIHDCLENISSRKEVTKAINERIWTIQHPGFNTYHSPITHQTIDLIVQNKNHLRQRCINIKHGIKSLYANNTNSEIILSNIANSCNISLHDLCTIQYIQPLSTPSGSSLWYYGLRQHYLENMFEVCGLLDDIESYCKNTMTLKQLCERYDIEHEIYNFHKELTETIVEELTESLFNYFCSRNSTILLDHSLILLTQEIAKRSHIKCINEGLTEKDPINPLGSIRYDQSTFYTSLTDHTALELGIPLQTTPHKWHMYLNYVRQN